LDLLKRQSKRAAELFLRQAFFEARGPHSAGDLDVSLIRLFPWHDHTPSHFRD
jgi:hypothetical protein